jgi:hypothetical protein
VSVVPEGYEDAHEPLLQETEPEPVVETERECEERRKLAETVRSLSIVTVQPPVPEHAPPQPLNS